MLKIILAVFLILWPQNATEFAATAYCLKGRTASGAYTRKGIIAADPRYFKIGQTVRITTPGYSGIYVVMDRGVKGKKIDIWMESTKECRKFGRRKVMVEKI